MAFKEKQILKCFLFIWLTFIKVSGFVVFNEGGKLNSVDPFNKNARTRQSFDRGNEKIKSGEQVGCLLIWRDQSTNSHADGSGRFSSDLGNEQRSDDSGWMKLQPPGYGLNTVYTPTVRRLLEMKPKVDCVGDFMKLTVHGREAPFGSSFLIDRGSIPPLPLLRLPSDCGHRFQRTWRNLVFIIPYDGCYVSQERETFVLPLLWWGLPVKMSCPSLTSRQKEPTVSCYTDGMIVRLHGEVENLKIKAMNEWQPLLKVSARCGYSLVSHSEIMVIHAPYMPCTEPKDGMYTLSMAVESEFNLSCPALSLNLPISVPDLAQNYTPTSMPLDLVSSTLPPTTIDTTEITEPLQTQSSTASTISTIPDYIPGQPSFEPVPTERSPNLPPMVVPLGPPVASTQQPQAPVFVKRPHTWYPWYYKPSLGTRVRPSQSTALPFPRKPLWPPTKAPKTPLNPLLKPTSIPQDKLISTLPVVPLFQWESVFQPRNVTYPLYPGKPEFVAPSSAVFPQDSWPFPQTEPGPSKPNAPPQPESALPTPAPTRKAGPQRFYVPWYKPIPVVLPVPTEVPQINTVPTSGADASNLTTMQSINGPPIDLPPSTYPTPSLPEFPEVVTTPAPIKACLTPKCLFHAHSFHCPTFCPGMPSISFHQHYHQHNHHYFGPSLPVSNLDFSSLTKIGGPMLSSPDISAGSTPFPPAQDMGYNNDPLSSQGTTVQQASDSTEMQYLEENPIIEGTSAPDTSKLLTEPTRCPSILRKLEPTTPSTPSTKKSANASPVRNPLWPSNGVVDVYSNQSPKPAVYQAEIGRYVTPWGHQNNFPFFERIPQHDLSSEPAMPPANNKNVYMNYWYRAAHSNAKPSTLDSTTKDSFSQLSLPQPRNNNSFEPLTNPLQPEQTGDSYWVPAV